MLLTTGSLSALAADTKLAKLEAVANRFVVFTFYAKEVTLPEHSDLIAATIPGAKLLILPSVHLSNIEYPGLFLLEFLIGNCVAVGKFIAAFINSMRKTRKGRQHAKKGKARRVQQMTKLRQKAVYRAGMSSPRSPCGGHGQ